MTSTVRVDIARGVRWLWRCRDLRLAAVETGPGQPDVVHGAVGGLAGSRSAGWVRKHLSTGPGMGLAVGTIAAGPLLAGGAWSVAVVMVACAVGAFGIMLWTVQAVVIRQRLVPRELMGRATSVYRLIGWGGPGRRARHGARRPRAVAGRRAVLGLSLLLVPWLAALDQTNDGHAEATN